ncbi:Biopolymer transport protein ExbD/TolR [compost metagenome]
MQTLGNGGRRQGSMSRQMALALPLTSLIDAFSIIVIYLLIGTQNSGMESTVPGKMNLPMAEHSIGVDKEVPVLKIEKGVYYVNEKAVAVKNLRNKLTELKNAAQNKELEILVQADQEMDYADLDPLLRAGSESGLTKMKFAVVPAK